MTASYLSGWTDIIVDVPNAPHGEPLTVAVGAQYETESLYGPWFSAVLYGGTIQTGDSALMVGLRAVPKNSDLEASTTAFSCEVVFEGVQDGVPQWSWSPHHLSNEPATYREAILDTEYPSAERIDISFTISVGSIVAEVNGLYGGMPPTAQAVPSGHIKVHISSSAFVNGYRQSGIGDLDSFSIGSGGAGESRFWTNFVNSYEVP